MGLFHYWGSWFPLFRSYHRPSSSAWYREHHWKRRISVLFYHFQGTISSYELSHRLVYAPCNLSWRSLSEEYTSSMSWYSNYLSFVALLNLGDCRSSVLFFNFNLSCPTSFYLIKFLGVLVTIRKMDIFAKNDDVSAHNKIFRNNKTTTSIWPEDLLSFEEGSLGNATIFEFRLCDCNWIIFKVVKDDDFPDSVIFKCWFDNWFFEVAVKPVELRGFRISTLRHAYPS